MTQDAPPDKSSSPISAEIDSLWRRRTDLTPADAGARAVVTAAIEQLDVGEARAAEVVNGKVHVDERARRAILLAFHVLEMQAAEVGPFRHHDRLPLKTRLEGVRLVPGAIARWGSYLAPGTVLMPSFVNIGAHVGRDTMVDTWATVGSCAQIGARVHIAGGAGIGGVLEPPGAVPVIVEDDAFVGSRAMVVEGARVRAGAKLGAGVLLTGSTRVYDAETGTELPSGEAPAWSVCVGATRPKAFPGGDFGTACLLVVRRLPEGGRHDKLMIDDVFRKHGVF